MVDCLYLLVKEAIKRKVGASHFVSITCDEVTSVDNGNWLCIHAYVDNFVRIPHLISLQRLVDGGGADSLISIIMKVLLSIGDLTFDQISRRLISFGADGINTFQGICSGVTMQIQTKFAPFCIKVHYMAH